MTTYRYPVLSIPLPWTPQLADSPSPITHTSHDITPYQTARWTLDLFRFIISRVASASCLDSTIGTIAQGKGLAWKGKGGEKEQRET